VGRLKGAPEEHCPDPGNHRRAPYAHKLAATGHGETSFDIWLAPA
jgi:hypothetical protein